MAEIETDYLVVGAGAAGMGFVDTLISESDADVVMVDRRHVPGGHWNDAYPFVRLHQPSAFYGVSSRALGGDQIDQSGPNAGMYERASAAEICDYYQRVLTEQMLPSGQVRFFGMSDYVGGEGKHHRFISRMTGEVTNVRVRRRLVDATYLEAAVPSTHTPAFEIDPAATVTSPNNLVSLAQPANGFTVIGAGKTAMDTCLWLLENSVAPDAIRWIRPRDAWLLDRANLQPLDLVATLIESVALQLEAAAQASDLADLFHRAEALGQLLRLDPDVTPTMFRGATVNSSELEALRTIDNVVRKGRVKRVDVDRIVLEGTTLPTEAGHVVVDCTASGLPTTPARPIFASDRITVQSIRLGSLAFSAALIAFIEVARDNDTERNRLCPPMSNPNDPIDWAAFAAATQRNAAEWSAQPDLHAWSEANRLNAARGIAEHFAEPRMQAAVQRLMTYREAALSNIDRLLAEAAKV